jgi:hypothetical protein
MVYYWNGILRGTRSRVVDFNSFLFPLDQIENWNLLYGPVGFVQYQAVVGEKSVDALQELLRLVAEDGHGSVLSVLKRFGKFPSPGLMSFPRPGFTLTFDLAMRGRKTLNLLDRLDSLVLGVGGALYPAKDARMSPAMFRQSFKSWSVFSEFVDPKLSSSFWRRVTNEL